MEFEFTVPGLASQYITLWDAAAVGRMAPEHFDNLKEVCNMFGKRSAKAQGLGTPVTDIYRLRSTDQRLYLAATRHAGITTVHGGLKVGLKKLFLRNEAHALHELQPTCVLDFYVHESCQRKGLGKQLFQSFLETEQLQPGSLAYDRPSPKLGAFLAKHYGLREYIPQSNNFVVYSCFWQYTHSGSTNRAGAARQGAPAPAALKPVQPSWACTQPTAQWPPGTAQQRNSAQALTSSGDTGYQQHASLHSQDTAVASGQRRGFGLESHEAAHSLHSSASRGELELGHSMHSTGSAHSSSLKATPWQAMTAGSDTVISNEPSLRPRDCIDDFRMQLYEIRPDDQAQTSAQLPFYQQGCVVPNAACVAPLADNRVVVAHAAGAGTPYSMPARQAGPIPGVANGAPAPSLLGSNHTTQGPAALYKSAVAPHASIARRHHEVSGPDACLPGRLQALLREPKPGSFGWGPTASITGSTPACSNKCFEAGVPPGYTRTEGAVASQLHTGQVSAARSLGSSQWVRPPRGDDNGSASYRQGSIIPTSAAAHKPQQAAGYSLQTSAHAPAGIMTGAGMAGGKGASSRAGPNRSLTGSLVSNASAATPGGHARLAAAAARSGTGAASCLNW